MIGLTDMVDGMYWRYMIRMMAGSTERVNGMSWRYLVWWGIYLRGSGLSTRMQVSVHMNAELSEFWYWCCLRRVCNVTLTVQYLHGWVYRRVHEGRIDSEDVRGKPPVKWINRVYKYWRELTGKSWMCWRGVPVQGILETSAVAAPLRELPLRWNSLSEIWIDKFSS